MLWGWGSASTAQQSVPPAVTPAILLSVSPDPAPPNASSPSVGPGRGQDMGNPAASCQLALPALGDKSWVGAKAPLQPRAVSCWHPPAAATVLRCPASMGEMHPRGHTGGNQDAWIERAHQVAHSPRVQLGPPLKPRSRGPPCKKGKGSNIESQQLLLVFL